MSTLSSVKHDGVTQRVVYHREHIVLHFGWSVDCRASIYRLGEVQEHNCFLQGGRLSGCSGEGTVTQGTAQLLRHSSVEQ